MEKEKKAVKNAIARRFKERKLGIFKDCVGEPSKFLIGGATYLYVWRLDVVGWEDQPRFALVTTNRGYPLDVLLASKSALIQAALIVAREV